MGFIKAGISAVSSELADQWREYIYCDAMDADVLLTKGEVRVTKGSSNTKRSDNIISDGSKVAVNEGQFLLVVENGKVVDFCAEPGAYIYQTGTEPSMLDSGWPGLKESFKKVGQRFTMGGQPDNDQRVYYINTKEILDNKVGFGEVPFRDSEFKFTILLKGYGVYSYKITDPIMFYTNVCGNDASEYRRSEIDGQLKTEVQNSLQPALGKIALKGIAYDSLPLFTKDIAEMVNQELTKEWVELRGISVISLAFSSITPDEESVKKIAQFQESRVYTDTGMLGARVGAAQATAMENAAANEGGAMNGFVGMGFAQQAGGASSDKLFEMDAQRKAAQDKDSAGANKTQWQCQCGAANTGKFCTECGVPKPQEVGWVCQCGNVNKGKFCSECGTKKPSGEPLYQCDKCGWEPEDPAKPPKFCPQCGDPFGEEDIK